jgi:hypothetical protein
VIIEGFVKLLLLFILLAFGVGCVEPPDAPNSAAGNQNPRIITLTASPDRMPVGQSSNVTVVADDPDGQPLTYRWVASTGDIIGEGESIRYTASFCCAGPNFIQVTVADNAGGSATKTLDIFIEYR